MKIGIFLLTENYNNNTQKAILDDIEFGVLAEELGFDEVWFGEHHFNPFSVIPNPSLMMASLAAKTKKIRIGAAAFLAPFYNSTRLAEEISTLDNLSNGRINAGFAKGGFSLDLEYFDKDAETLGVDAHIFSYGYIVLNLLLGTLAGAWIGVNFATGVNKERLNTYIFYLLLFLSIVLFSHIFLDFTQTIKLPYTLQLSIGFITGLGIGIISSLLGVAGGELLIPTIILLYGTDIKLAGTLSLAISLPTLIVSLFKYHKNKRLIEVLTFKNIIIFMTLGSILGAFLGSLLFGVINALFLEAGLSFILLLSAYKLFKKTKT